MTPDNTVPPVESGLIVQSGGALARLPDGGTPALAEIINRSLVQILTSKALAARHRIGEHELCGPDYRLVCALAEDMGLTPEETLRRLLLTGGKGLECWDTRIENGRFKALRFREETLRISSIPVIEGLGVETVSLGLHEGFVRLDVSMFPNLTELSCWNNQLTEMDLSHVPNLTVLSCNRNQLTELNLSQVPNLTELWCYQNHLTELDLSHVPNLTVLSCSGNQLAELDLSQVPNLTELACNENHLTELDLSHVPNLSWLSCSGNHLTELDLSQVPNLTLLSCSGNQLTVLDLSNVPNLTLLSCSGNQLTVLDLSKFPISRSLLATRIN